VSSWGLGYSTRNAAGSSAGVRTTDPVRSFSFTATSEGFSADIPKLDTLKVGIASTTNTVNRKVSAYLLSSTVSASEMAVLASNDSTLSVSLESMAVFDSEAAEGEAQAEAPAEGEAGGSGMQMAFGGTFAWNQFNGQVLAYVEDSTFEATDGDLAVQAVSSAALEAQSKAGTAVSSGAAAGASLAFNAVGWDMGNIAAAGLNSILGTDIGATASPLPQSSSCWKSAIAPTHSRIDTNPVLMKSSNEMIGLCGSRGGRVIASASCASKMSGIPNSTAVNMLM
jgi:hypothetical protein